MSHTVKLHDTIPPVLNPEEKYTICFDTLCTGFQPVLEGDKEATPVQYNTEAEAQAEIDSDPEFYDDCFVCLMSEIGHKTIV